jgi:hypothetical protein
MVGPAGVSNEVKLTAFGLIPGSACKAVSFGSGEFVSNFTFYYTKSKIEGFTYMTNGGVSGVMGSLLSTSKDPIMNLSFVTTQQYPFMGFFGTATSTTLYSLGLIREKTDCTNFATTTPTPPSTTTLPTNQTTTT